MSELCSVAVLLTAQSGNPLQICQIWQRISILPDNVPENEAIRSNTDVTGATSTRTPRTHARVSVCVCGYFELLAVDFLSQY